LICQEKAVIRTSLKYFRMKKFNLNRELNREPLAFPVQVKIVLLNNNGASLRAYIVIIALVLFI